MRLFPRNAGMEFTHRYWDVGYNTYTSRHEFLMSATQRPIDDRGPRRLELVGHF
jgi:hypothetical protein